MSRASLVTLLFVLLSPAARAADSCGDHLRAFNLYEVMEDDAIVAKHALFPVPEEWSDASAFHGVVSDASDVSLEVMVEGKKKTFAFGPWDQDHSLFVAEGFRAKKILKNSELGAFFTLRLKRNGKTVCEKQLEISGD